MTVYFQVEAAEGIRASRDEVPEETIDVEFVLLPPREYHVWDNDQYYSASILGPDAGWSGAMPEVVHEQVGYWDCLAAYVPDADTFVTALEVTVQRFDRFHNPPFDRHEEFPDVGGQWWYTPECGGHYNYLHPVKGIYNIIAGGLRSNVERALDDEFRAVNVLNEPGEVSIHPGWAEVDVRERRRQRYRQKDAQVDSARKTPPVEFAGDPYEGTVVLDDPASK